MILRNRKYLGLVLCSAIGGILLAISQSSLGNTLFINMLILIALFPIFLAVELLQHLIPRAGKVIVTSQFFSFMQRAWKAFALFWIAGITFYFITFYSLIYQNFFNIYSSEAIAFGLIVLFSLSFGLYFPFVFLPYILNAGRMHKKNATPLPFWALALSSAVLEVVLPRFLPWTFGNSIKFSNSLMYFNSILGASTLSPLLFGGNAFLALAFVKRPRSLFTLGIPLLVYAVSWLLLSFIGNMNIDSEHMAMRKIKTAKVWVLESSSENQKKAAKSLEYLNENSENIFAYLQAFPQIKQDATKPALIVAPRYSYLSSNKSQEYYIKNFIEVSKSANIPFLIESISPLKAVEGVPTRRFAFLVRPDGSTSEELDKCEIARTSFFTSTYLSSLTTADFFSGQLARFNKEKSECVKQSLSFTPDFKVTPILGDDIFDTSYISKLFSKKELGFLVNFFDEPLYSTKYNLSLGEQQTKTRSIEFARSALHISSQAETVAFSPVGETLAPHLIGEFNPLALKIVEFEIPVSEIQNGKETFYFKFYRVIWFILGAGLIMYFLVTSLKRK